MITVKPNDLIVQRPDESVTYSLTAASGWPPSSPQSVGISRLKPTEGTQVPDLEVKVSGNELALTPRRAANTGMAGTPGARYSVRIRDQRWTLGVSWFLPGSDRESLPPGHVWMSPGVIVQTEPKKL